MHTHSKNYLKYVACVIFIAIYAFLAFERLDMADSDVFRIIDEFKSAAVTDYTDREPFYWLIGKALFLYSSDDWLPIYVYDAITLALLLILFKKQKIELVYLPFLILAPFLVLGITNIHRQFVSVIMWIAISRFFFNGRLLWRSVVGAFFFLFHNSVGVVVLVDIISDLLTRKKFVTAGLIGLVVVIVLINSAGTIDYYREGTEVGTPAYVYLGWATSLLLVGAILGAARSAFILFALGILTSYAFYVVSGGSSGSRLFLAFAVIYSIDVYKAASSLKSNIHKIVFLPVFILISIAPTFLNEFSRSLFLNGMKYFV